MAESRDSPARKKQFRVICAVMVSTLLYATVTAGVFKSITVEMGEFPGGEFIYKSNKRDYAAAPSLLRQIADDLEFKRRHYPDRMYSVFLDRAGTLGSGRNLRFACGFLAKDNEEDQALKTQLLDMNAEIDPPTKLEYLDLPAYKLWPRLRYKQQTLPKTEAAVVKFAYTDGFVSSFMHDLRIFPALRKYAAEHSGVSEGSVTIVSSCNPVDSVCTHYAPLSGDFLLGQPSSEEYAKTLPPEKLFDFDDLERMCRRSSIGKRFGWDKGGKQQPNNSGKDEL